MVTNQLFTYFCVFWYVQGRFCDTLLDQKFLGFRVLLSPLRTWNENHKDCHTEGSIIIYSNFLPVPETAVLLPLPLPTTSKSKEYLFQATENVLYASHHNSNIES